MADFMGEDAEDSTVAVVLVENVHKFRRVDDLAGRSRGSERECVASGRVSKEADAAAPAGAQLRERSFCDLKRRRSRRFI
jgi:hypothetical protein